MRRRTILLGVGSLAAGGAAVMGTGSVSTVRAQRNVTGRIAGDGQAYVEFRGNGANGFAVENLGGEMRLDFDGRPDGGNGLNPDAVSTFDDAFRLNNTGRETLAVHIEDTNDRVEFYFGESISDGSASNDRTTTAPLAPGGSPLRVGVRVDLRNTTAQSVFDGDDDFVIVAEDATTNA